MAEEAADVELQEITPDMFDGEQETPKAESSTEKEAAVKPEAEKTPEAETKEESPETDKETEPKATDDAETQKAVEPEKPLAKADERKAQLNTEIRDLLSQRNAIKAEVEKANAETYQTATEDELVDQGLSATDAKVEALRQQIEIRDYNEKVAEAQLTLSSESERVLRDFSWANSEDGESYKKELAEEAATLLEANLIRDPNTGQIIGSNVSPYQLYKTLDRASKISTVEGQLKGQKDAQTMLANADAGGTAAPAKKPVDPLTALWLED